MGVGAVAALLLRRHVPRAPGPLIVVVAAALVVLIPGVAGEVAVPGNVPAGLPVFALPSFDLSDIGALLPAAAAITLVSYLESISTATTFARRTRGRVDANGELIGIGAANLAVGFFRGFTVGGRLLARGGELRGRRTHADVRVLAALIVAVALLTVTPLLALMPKVALAAVIIVAVASLVDLRGARSIARVRRSDLVALVTTFLAPPYFANSRAVAGRLGDAIALRPQLQAVIQAVILDAGSLPWIDHTGTEVLAELDEALRAAGVALHLAAARSPVTDVVARSADSAHLLAEGRVHADVPAAVRSLDRDPGSPPRPDAAR